MSPSPVDPQAPTSLSAYAAPPGTAASPTRPATCTNPHHLRSGLQDHPMQPPAWVELMASPQPSLGQLHRLPTLHITNVITGSNRWICIIRCVCVTWVIRQGSTGRHLVRSAVAAGTRSNAAMAVDRNHGYGVMVMASHVLAARPCGVSWGLWPVWPAALPRIRLHTHPVIWLTTSISPASHSLAVLAPLHNELQHAHGHQSDY